MFYITVIFKVLKSSSLKLSEGRDYLLFIAFGFDPAL